MARTLLGLLALAFTSLAAASRTAHAPSEAAVFGIVSVRLAAIWDADVSREARQNLETKTARFRAEIVKSLGLPPGEIERITAVVFKVSSGIDESQQFVTVIVPRKPFDVAAFAKGRKEKLARGKLADLPDFAVYEGEPGNRFAVNGKLIVLLDDGAGELPDAAAVESAMIVKAIKRDADRAAMFAAEKNVMSLAIDVPELVRSASGGAFDDDAIAQRNLPEALQPLLRARIFTATASLSNSVSVQGEIAFNTAEDAAAAKPALELGLQQLQRLLRENEVVNPDSLTTKTYSVLKNFAEALLADATVTRKDRTLLIAGTRLIAPEISKAAAQGIVIAEVAAMRAQSQNNLRRIAMAAQFSIDANNGGIIENICDDKGKPLLSWRVRLLPFMDQEELYKQFKLDEPWDSEHNRKLIAKMPKVFAAPSPKTVKEGMTFYQAFVGKKGDAARPILEEGDPKGLGYQSITDGTSNTILAVEAADAVTWTKPEDIPFDNEAKAPKLGGHFDGGCNAAFCDGSVHFLKDTLPEITLKALITANGGEDVILDD